MEVVSKMRDTHFSVTNFPPPLSQNRNPSFRIFNLLSTIFGTTRARGFQIWYLALKHSTNQFALNIRKLWTRVARFNPYGFLVKTNLSASRSITVFRFWNLRTTTNIHLTCFFSSMSSMIEGSSCSPCRSCFSGSTTTGDSAVSALSLIFFFLFSFFLSFSCFSFVSDLSLRCFRFDSLPSVFCGRKAIPWLLPVKELSQDVTRING